MSGCIMVPTASPQSRSVPMPTYETPLVSDILNYFDTYYTIYFFLIYINN